MLLMSFAAHCRWLVRLWTRESFQGIPGQEKSNGLSSETTSGQAARGKAKCGHRATSCQQKKNLRKNNMVKKKKITGTLEGTDRGKGEWRSPIRRLLCGKTVAVECLKLRKIQDFYQKRCEKKFQKSAPEKKKNKVSFITQHICLSAFCNTPSLNSSSREGSVNIVELNVNSSSFTVFLTVSTTSDNSKSNKGQLFFSVPCPCLYARVCARERKRVLDRERERERSELFKPSPAVRYPSDLCLCYFPLLNTKW